MKFTATLYKLGHEVIATATIEANSIAGAKIKTTKMFCEEERYTHCNIELTCSEEGHLSRFSRYNRYSKKNGFVWDGWMEDYNATASTTAEAEIKAEVAETEAPASTVEPVVEEVTEPCDYRDITEPCDFRESGYSIHVTEDCLTKFHFLTLPADTDIEVVKMDVARMCSDSSLITEVEVTFKKKHLATFEVEPNKRKCGEWRPEEGRREIISLTPDRPSYVGNIKKVAGRIVFGELKPLDLDVHGASRIYFAKGDPTVWLEFSIDTGCGYVLGANLYRRYMGLTEGVRLLWEEAQGLAEEYGLV